MAFFLGYSSRKAMFLEWSCNWDIKICNAMKRSILYKTAVLVCQVGIFNSACSAGTLKQYGNHNTHDSDSGNYERKKKKIYADSSKGSAVIASTSIKKDILGKIARICNQSVSGELRKEDCIAFAEEFCTLGIQIEHILPDGLAIHDIIFLACLAHSLDQWYEEKAVKNVCEKIAKYISSRYWPQGKYSFEQILELMKLKDDDWVSVAILIKVFRRWGDNASMGIARDQLTELLLLGYGTKPSCREIDSVVQEHSQDEDIKNLKRQVTAGLRMAST